MHAIRRDTPLLLAAAGRVASKPVFDTSDVEQIHKELGG